MAAPADATGTLSPWFQALDLLQGVDRFTGEKYRGAGANQSPLLRVVLVELAGLPQVPLAQHYLAARTCPASRLSVLTARADVRAILQRSALGLPRTSRQAR